MKMLDFILSGNKFNLIPLVTQIFALLVLNRLSLRNMITFKLLLAFLPIFIAHMLKLNFPSDESKKCDANTPNVKGIIIEQLLNTIIQYGFAVAVPNLVVLAPGPGMIFRILSNLPLIGSLVKLMYWAVGFKIGNMLTVESFKLFWLIRIGNSNPCDGNINLLKKILGVVSFIAIIIFEIVGTIRYEMS